MSRQRSVGWENGLGPAVVVGTNSTPKRLGRLFTTDAYNREAFKLVLQEANCVAQELQLPEKLPITEQDAVDRFVVRYGMSEVYPRMIGSIHTRHYGYFVSVGHKLSFVMRTGEERECSEWAKRFQWPLGNIDTNAAYQLATQWLAAAKMDVQALDRNCKMRVELNPYWNQALYGTGKFVPIYEVSWASPENQAERDRLCGSRRAVCSIQDTASAKCIRYEIYIAPAHRIHQPRRSAWRACEVMIWIIPNRRRSRNAVRDLILTSSAQFEWMLRPLNRDCSVVVQSERDCVPPAQRKFVPVYHVHWRKRNARAGRIMDVPARVRVFTPEKILCDCVWKTQMHSPPAGGFY